MFQTITTIQAQTLTDSDLRDEMQHAAYVVSTLLVQGLDTHAKDRLNVFRVLREESQRRHG
ncbi:MAG: hypothetical protein ACTHVO_09405 [Brevibacterium yomogidense]